MPDDYVKRSDVHKAFQPKYAPAINKTFAAMIDSVPAADVVEVRHGTWCVTDAYPHNVYCSECYKRFAQEHWGIWKDGSLPRDYCPSCGAKMDGTSADYAPAKPYDLLYEEGGPDA